MAVAPTHEREVVWTYKRIDGTWCVGMKGNLDTIYDATIRITGGWLSIEEAEEVARSIVEQHNALVPEKHRY